MSPGDGTCGSEGCGCQDTGSIATPGEAQASLLDRLDNEEGFHPLGEDWESEMRELLDDTEYDTELGMQMARDAMRLVAGDMSEEDFYEEYNEAVVGEFGEDDRPMADLFEPQEFEDSSLVDSLAKLGDTDVSRRETMKKMAFGAGALGLGGVLPTDQLDRQAGGESVANAQDTGGITASEGKQYGMVIDLERCDGCLECVIGCMDEHRWDSGANWMYVLTYQEELTDEENFLVRPCQHCTNAPCVKVCPVRARHRRSEDGIVLTNYETCIGCRYCQVACPYGVNYFGWGQPEVPREELDTVDYTGPELRRMSREERAEVLRDSGDRVHDIRGWETGSRPRKGTMGKCTFNVHRQDGNRGEELVDTTACMEACDTTGMSAIHFGDLNDPDSRPNRYLERRKEIEPAPAEKAEQFDDPEPWEDPPAPHHTAQLSAFKLLEEMGTQPNIVYLGNQPGPTAEQKPDNEQPVRYADIRSRVDDRDIISRGKDRNDEWTDWRAFGR